jgi:hypothetical protein
VRNRGGSNAANLVATVFWAPVATLLTPDMWTLVGSATLPNVPAGNLLTVSPHITWPQAAIPGPGHYCFVGIIGNSGDPAPEPADFLDWSNYQRYIRENNNVTWRNFNVVPGVTAPGFGSLPFLAPGAPDRARRMRLKVVARLPARARLFLEIPEDMGDALKAGMPLVERDENGGRIRVPVNPHGEFALREFPFPAKSRAEMRLMVQLPKESSGNAFEVFVQQLCDEEEVGRVTWRLVPNGNRNN